MAFSLEVASEEDGTNEGYIKIHTPKLLNLYRSYKDKLSALEEDVSDDDTNKNPISKDDLTDAYAAIIELIESVDYETAEELIKSLDNYALPQNEKKKFSELKKYASAFDWNSAAKVLKP